MNLILILKYWHFIAIGVLVALLSLVSFLYIERGHRINDIQAAHKIESLEAEKKHNAEVAQINLKNQEQLQHAQAEYDKKQTKIINDYHDAVTANNSLLDTLNSIDASIADLPEQTRAIYQDTKSDVFAECTGALVELAETADRINADRDRLYQAWITN